MLKLTILACCIAFAFSIPAAPAIGDKSVLCDKCKLLVDQYITDANVAKVLQYGAQACDSFPAGLGDKCKTLVSQYGAQVASEILADKDQLCSMAHLCPSTKMMRQPKFYQLKKHLLADASGLTCSACKMGIDVFDSIIDSTLFKEDLETMMQTAICGLTPSSDCVITIASLYNQILALLKSAVACKDICQTAIPGCKC